MTRVIGPLVSTYGLASLHQSLEQSTQVSARGFAGSVTPPPTWTEGGRGARRAGLRLGDGDRPKSALTFKNAACLGLFITAASCGLWGLRAKGRTGNDSEKGVPREVMLLRRGRLARSLGFFSWTRPRCRLQVRRGGQELGNSGCSLQLGVLSGGRRHLKFMSRP